LVCAVNNVPAPTYPAQFSSVISVAAHDGRDPFSLDANPAPPADFGAPGTILDPTRRATKSARHRRSDQLGISRQLAPPLVRRPQTFTRSADMPQWLLPRQIRVLSEPFPDPRFAPRVSVVLFRRIVGARQGSGSLAPISTQEDRDNCQLSDSADERHLTCRNALRPRHGSGDAEGRYRCTGRSPRTLSIRVRNCGLTVADRQ